MMWCFRMLVFAAVLFSGRVLGGVTVTMSEIPDAVYLTTTITVYDGTVTPTDSIETSTVLSDIPSLHPTPSSHSPPPAHVPLPGFIPLPQPEKEVFSSVSRLSTFITHTIPRITAADSSSSLTIMATSTSSAAPALTQSDAPPPPSSAQPTMSTGEAVGLCIGGAVMLFIALGGAIWAVRAFQNGTSCYECCDCSDYSDRRDCSDWGKSFCVIVMAVVCIPFTLLVIVFLAVRDLVKGKPRKKRSEQLQNPGADAQGDTRPVELDATNEIIGEPSAPETRPYHSHPPATVPVTGELDGGSTALPHGSLATSQKPAELHTSVGSGDSSLPRYEELDTNGRSGVFSWAAPESAYQPDK
ncbi:hypothetical protein GGI35DRAFT_105891 [Trichoderma velutinum]